MPTILNQLDTELKTFDSTRCSAGDRSCSYTEIDCSSAFGTDAAFCQINCGSWECVSTQIFCPRYTNGQGNCTLNCIGFHACLASNVYGQSVADLQVNCIGSDACSGLSISHYEPTAKVLSVNVFGVRAGGGLDVSYGGSNDSETTVYCYGWDQSAAEDGVVCWQMHLSDVLGDDNARGGSLFLDCRYLDLLNIADNFTSARQSCVANVEAQRTREINIWLFEAYSVDERNPAQIIHNADSVTFLYPQGMHIYLGEVGSFTFYLSHGMNKVYSRSTFLQFYFLGDFLGDEFDFVYNGPLVPWGAGEPKYRNETATIVFSSDIPSAFYSTYYTYLARYPSAANSIGAAISLPSDEFAKRAGITIIFEAVKSHSFSYVSLVKKDEAPLGGVKELFLLCYGSRTCRSFRILPVILATHGTFAALCTGEDSCGNSVVAIDMVGSGDAILLCQGDGPCQGLQINLFHFNFADTTQLSGQSLAAQCLGTGDVCHDLILVILPLSLLPSFKLLLTYVRYVHRFLSE